MASSVSSAWSFQSIILVPGELGPRASPLRIGWGFDKDRGHRADGGKREMKSVGILGVVRIK